MNFETIVNFMISNYKSQKKNLYFTCFMQAADFITMCMPSL